MIASTDTVIATDLERFDEDDAAAWIRTCSRDEFVRVCSVAEWIAMHEPSDSPSEQSVSIAKAFALAAVYVHEGAPRELKRPRRRPATAAQQQTAATGGRWPGPKAHLAAPPEHGVGDDARAFWGQ